MRRFRAVADNTGDTTIPTAVTSITASILTAVASITANIPTAVARITTAVARWIELWLATRAVASHHYDSL